MKRIKKKERRVKDFDTYLKQALSVLAEEKSKELYKDDTPVHFSSEHKKWEEKILEKVKQNELYHKKLQRRLKYRKYRKRATAVAMVFSVVAGVTVFSVDAFRVRFLNFIIEITDSHSQINFGNSPDSTAEKGDLQFGYLPNGFILSENEIREDMIYFKFIKNDEYFTILRREGDMSVNVDTEDAVVETTVVNGMKALFSLKHDLNTLVFRNNTYSYSVCGNINKDEIMKIAENIKSMEE